MLGNGKKSGDQKEKRQPLNTSGGSVASNSSSRSRKRKRCEMRTYSESDLESELEDCNMNDALEIERKLRNVARKNCLSDEEMRKLLQKFIKNDHILALVTLKAEDELAREKKALAEQRAVIITDNPSVPKLTRAKARELNCTPGLTLPPLNEAPIQSDIEVLIREDLHSDDDDEEYTFKEDDFVSDDEPNTTSSDFDSNPCTPQTPYTAAEESPVKFSEDGCFKVPLDKSKVDQEGLRIAARTRSKLCLQETTIEDIQSEFVPPDVELSELQEHDTTINDEDWMQFLNDFSKPLNNSFTGDDDDPINDPEYVAAEKVPLDAEELRDVNISKKELNDLVSELFEGLLEEGVSLENIDLETPQKFLYNNINTNNATNSSGEVVSRDNVSRQINFETVPENSSCVDVLPINNVQNDYSFHPNVMSTPSSGNIDDGLVTVPIANESSTTSDLKGKMVTISNSAGNTDPILIAVPLEGQPNCYQLAKVISSGDSQLNYEKLEKVAVPSVADKVDTRYTTPYDSNFTYEYISVRKHIYSEYLEKFESLKNIKPINKLPDQLSQKGLTQEQHDLLQQQLRIHVQMLTQTFLQTYSHPKLYSMAKKPKEMLDELKNRSKTHATFNAWNLNDAVQLIETWVSDLNSDKHREENAEMMDFIHQEIELTDSNTRQVSRLPPRIMHLMLDSPVFMYPQYLPRMSFSPKTSQFTAFSPAEYQLIAMGLEKHLADIKRQRIHKSACPIRCACKRMAKDTLFGKHFRRLYEKVRELRDDSQYNPVKYYFEHERAPPVEHVLITFDNNVPRPPRECYNDLPPGWKYFVNNNPWKKGRKPPLQLKTAAKASKPAGASYFEFVREAVGEDIPLPENFAEASAPDGSATGAQYLEQHRNKTEVPPFATASYARVNVKDEKEKPKIKRRPRRRATLPSSLTINVNYVFGNADVTNNLTGTDISVPSATTGKEAFVESIASFNSSTNTKNSALLQNTETLRLESSVPALNYSYDFGTQTLQPVLQSNQSTKESIPLLDNKPSQELETKDSTKKHDIEKRSNYSICSKDRRTIRHRNSSFTAFKARSYSTHCRSTSRNRLRNAFHQREIFIKRQNRRKLGRRCCQLIVQYRKYLQNQAASYVHCKPIQYYHKRFLALDLYTRLLVDLKMFCRSKVINATTSPGAAVLPTNQRRPRGGGTSEDDPSTGSGRSRRGNRQEENFRHMLQPDTAEETDRKDGIFAYNFYEKVEESLIGANREEDFKKFSQLLKNFDPRTSNVSDLYLKVEQLLLPEYPDLAEVFLNFLLPAEAAQIGKFFDHFMITNAATFINKLNIFFNKQPAQIRKIYACLSELADKPNVTMKQVESKILPLLRGNQFLIDWFMQQFPSSKPPERILPTPETININEVFNNTSGEYMETMTELLDSPTQEQQQHGSCQLKYINGRIFYGSKILLPAKLSFLANNIYNERLDDGVTENPIAECAHGIREHGEKLIATAVAMESALDCNSDDNDRSEEDDVSRTLVIDTTCDEDNSSSSFELCDDIALRGHALRLNPGYYSSFNNATVTSTPNVATTHQTHHPHAKRTSINFVGSGGAEECRVSPRKNSLTNSPLTGAIPSTSSATPTSTATSASVNAAVSRTDKRKSPTKKGKSPIAVNIRQATRPQSSNMRTNMQPMVVIHEQEASSAIACAKRLKTLIEGVNTVAEETADNKANLCIIAREKVSSNSSTQTHTTNTKSTTTGAASVAKAELEDNMENPCSMPAASSSATSPISLSQRSFPAIKMDLDTSEEEDQSACTIVSATLPPTFQHVITTQFDSDEDCKLDVVATLANCPEVICSSASSASSDNKSSNKTSTTAAPQVVKAVETLLTTATVSLPQAWTRDEDKIILIEMKLGASSRNHLLERIQSKLPQRSMPEITARHQFLMDFLSKLQGKA